ncbi:unnamed protein product [Mytilus coruscus]|uniref:Uncharacterized protein n=1 Tax=Mytilus coruscus TaxID=42192 RepID=A0A6J8BEX6_MYTCO|nr:unnamed protein product [Mytilus coruscus]
MVWKENITSVPQIRVLLEVYMKTTLFQGQDIPAIINKRFWPSNVDIQNHIALAVKKQRNKEIDQVCSHGEDDTYEIEFKEENTEILCQEKDPKKLKNYDDFRRKCKPLSHIKVRREGGYFHHFVVLAISTVSDGIDAVTIGQYISSSEIGMETCDGIGNSRVCNVFAVLLNRRFNTQILHSFHH